MRCIRCVPSHKSGNYTLEHFDGGIGVYPAGACRSRLVTRPGHIEHLFGRPGKQVACWLDKDVAHAHDALPWCFLVAVAKSVGKVICCLAYDFYVLHNAIEHQHVAAAHRHLGNETSSCSASGTKVQLTLLLRRYKRLVGLVVVIDSDFGYTTRFFVNYFYFLGTVIQVCTFYTLMNDTRRSNS